MSQLLNRSVRSPLFHYHRRVAVRRRRQHQPQQQQQQQLRSMAIYAVGEGWTGALRRENVLSTIQGHFDEDPSDAPLLIYPHDNVKQAVAGWGCSIILDTNGQIHTVGRPQDLMTLFRLKRMPKAIRDWIGQQSDPSETTPVGTFVSKLIGWASGGADEQPWEVAREYSFLNDWTQMDFNTDPPIGDTEMSSIVAGPGFMAMISPSGALYTLGINNRGQCGIGVFSNNVWTPHPVKGISSEKKERDTDLFQDMPVVQAALGFQHGFALTDGGRIYSWGKMQRGQLGRDIEVDQDPTARLIEIDPLVQQISSAHHHGAALTVDNDIYIWGRNMRVNKDGKPGDLFTPERLSGLPADLKIEKISSGSHHTAFLMEDGSVYGIGVASDEAVPLLDPVLIVEAGILEMPVKQFEAHHDRTSIIDHQGNVFQVHLWKDKSLQEYSLFSPSYIDFLLDQGESIQSIHRGWRHTLIVTERN